MTESKGLFIGLLLLSLVVVGVLVSGIWYLNFYGFNLLSYGVLLIISLVLSVVSLILVLGIIGILLTIRLQRPIKSLVIPIKLVIAYFLPVVIHLGAFLGFDKEEIQSSFIKMSNQLINPEDIEVNAQDILILLPHCIQLADCNFRVTSDLDNCQRCGRCQVDDLIGLQKKYGLNLAIATGGTLARKIIKETRPKAIIAVACERDLSTGIQDVYPMPVMGVVNLRPNGPCVNTGVEMEKIEKAVEKLIFKEPIGEKIVES
ncbi:DUF116 domain-containing protein [Natroniella sulfidigena]|uniref:DUF116 domain-containing protein n=1 Tax=Natroniella sulfidigena TaxID=723921 RepID=UPI00200ADCE4|nr:DUF116 domain-containing protein [Natroniella sulfidigena]MCK8817821.1 DUF116 domain-containing protein [Natroniella sulfidigena]